MKATTPRIAPITCSLPNPVAIASSAPKHITVATHRRRLRQVASSARLKGSAITPTPPLNPLSAPSPGGRTFASPSLLYVLALEPFLPTVDGCTSAR